MDVYFNMHVQLKAGGGWKGGRYRKVNSRAGAARSSVSKFAQCSECNPDVMTHHETDRGRS